MNEYIINNESIRDFSSSLKINFNLAERVLKEVPPNIKILEHISSDGGIGDVFLGTRRNQKFSDTILSLEDLFFCVKLYREENEQEILHINNLPFNSRDKNGNLLVDICDIKNPGMMKVRNVTNNLVISEYCGNCDLTQLIEESGENKINKKAMFLMYFWDLLFTVYKNIVVDKISHNDIKPNNIHFHKGRLKLVDFDLILKTNSTFFKKNKYNLGTFLFSAPEQSLNGLISKKNDIYSLGVILYKFTQETHPFLNFIKNTKQHLKKETREIDQFDWNKYISSNYLDFPVEYIGFGHEKMTYQLIQGMLHRNPEDRLDIKRTVEFFYFCFNDYLNLPSIELKKEQFGIPSHK